METRLAVTAAIKGATAVVIPRLTFASNRRYNRKLLKYNIYTAFPSFPVLFPHCNFEEQRPVTYSDSESTLTAPATYDRG